MKPIRFDHIAIAVPRMTEATPFVSGELGGIPHYGGPSGAYRWQQWRFESGRLELLEPLGEESFLHRFLAKHGPGIHHVTFKVPNLREACERAEAHGYAIVGYNDSNRLWREAFLHPKQALGIVVQLAEVTGAGGAESRRPPEPPPGPEPRPAPVTILGLRMRARSAERARVQWGSVLEGECAEVPGDELRFRWPGSAMHLAVEIDPASDEGPVAIEVASTRPLALPRGPHPVLGAVFLGRSPGG